MSLIRGLFVRKDATRGTTPVEARKALAGLLTPAGTFGARPGVLSGFTVSGTTGWAYSSAAGHIGMSRGVTDGVILAANDGAATIPTDAAPGTGGRIDIIWVKHSDVDAGDPTSGNDFGVTKGVVSGSPQAPALPVGVLELARATVLAGATSTSHANVTITNTFQRTGLRGAVIDVPDAAARIALGNPPAGTTYMVSEVSTGILWRNAGTGWSPVHGDVPWTTYTPALGGMSIGSGSLWGRYQITGKTVDAYIEAVLGTGFSVSTGITAQLPAQPKGFAFGYRQLGTCFLYHPSTNAINQGLVTWNSSTGQVWQRDGTTVTSVSPWAWAVGDIISWTLRYEMA